MYKSKLQVLCQQNSWNLPKYSTIKDGLDHNPRFAATVTVNGVTFETADPSRTAKGAQNKAAELAFHHLSSRTHPNPPTLFSDLGIQPSVGGTLQPTMTEIRPIGLVNGTPLGGVNIDKKFVDMHHLYKNRLQTYAQKRNLKLPVYSCECEGPPHASRFEAKVTFDGKTYKSPQFYFTVKEAEHAAAKVALESLPHNEVQEDDSGLYKNLLQELAQKKGFFIPKYETAVSGPPHSPTFVSTVEIGGQSFRGQAAKSKKLAEMNVAKVAYFGLQELISQTQCPEWQDKDEEQTDNSECPVIREAERKDKDEAQSGCGEPIVVREPGGASLIPTCLPSGSEIKEALKVSSYILQSVITSDLQQNRPKANLIIHEAKDENYSDGNEGMFLPLCTSNAEGSTHDAPALPPEEQANAKRHRCSPSFDCLQVPFPSKSAPPKTGVSSSSMHLSKLPAGAGST